MLAISVALGQVREVLEVIWRPLGLVSLWQPSVGEWHTILGRPLTSLTKGRKYSSPIVREDLYTNSSGLPGRWLCVCDPCDYWTDRGEFEMKATSPNIRYRTTHLRQPLNANMSLPFLTPSSSKKRKRPLAGGKDEERRSSRPGPEDLEIGPSSAPAHNASLYGQELNAM